MEGFHIKDYFIQKRTMSVTEWLVDCVIAAGAFGLGCLQLTMAINLLIPDEALRRIMGIQTVAPSLYAIFAVATTTLPLVVRRKFPWIVYLVALIAWSYFQAQIRGITLSVIGPMIALFTVATERSRFETLGAGVLGVCFVVLVPGTAQAQTVVQMTIVQNAAFMAAAALAGYAIHSRQEYLKAAEERALAAERTRETLAQRRVEEERVRIAREVHDITAHSLSAVSIQAAVAQRLIDTDPKAAKEAIVSARQTAKSALEDIRAMIGVLRMGDEKAESGPTEGTDRMGDLINYLENAGVQARLDDVAYDQRLVPAHIDVALFGIAREASTNIVRHAQASEATITLTSAAGEALLSIEDNGAGATIDVASAAGHGLEGMRERVNLLGGSFSAGNRKEGGFRIEARVPLSRGDDSS